MSDNKFHMGRVLENFEKVKRELPVLLANQAQNFFMDSWKKQGWDDAGVKKWQEVNRRKQGTAEYKYPKGYGLSRRTNPILVGGGKTKGSSGGNLRRAVGNSAMVKLKSFEKISLVVDEGYAAYLNNGTPNMVARKFMGESKTLNMVLKGRITKYINGIWKI